MLKLRLLWLVLGVIKLLDWMVLIRILSRKAGTSSNRMYTQEFMNSLILPGCMPL